MALDHPLASPREDAAAQQHKSTLGEFASGLESHLRAPFAGLADTLTGQVIASRTAEPATPETKSRLAGEMAGDAIVFLGATALLKQIPSLFCPQTSLSIFQSGYPPYHRTKNKSYAKGLKVNHAELLKGY